MSQESMQSPTGGGNTKGALIKHLKNKLSTASKGMENFAAQVEAINASPKSPSKKSVQGEGSPAIVGGSKYVDKLMNVYENVLDVINNMDTKLVGNVLNSQDSMLTAYRHKFIEIQEEMKELRAQLSEEKLKLRRDKQIRMLEEERDWYREELQKADARHKKVDAENRILREECEEALKDRKNLHIQLLELKKENKALTQGKDAKNFQRESSRASIKNTQQKEEERTSRLQTTQSQERIRRLPELTIGTKTHSDKLYEDMVTSLKKQLENERKANRILKAEKVREKIKETELREFFINCVEEVKKDILLRQKAGGSTLRTQKSKILPGIDPEPLGTFDNSPNTGANSPRQAVPLNAFLSSDKRKVMEMMFGKEDFIDSLVQVMFPAQGGIKVKNPITELVSKSKESASKRKSLDLKRLTVKRGRKKINYIEYKPYGIYQ